MELTLDQALQKGVEAHKAGKAQEAERYYTAILQANPKHPDANHNMGVLAVGVGKLEESLPFFKTALEVNQTIAQFWLSYIDDLIKLDQIDDAKAGLEQAKSNGLHGERFDQLEHRISVSEKTITVKNSNVQEPPKEQLQPVINLYTQGQLEEALSQSNTNVFIFGKPSSTEGRRMGVAVAKAETIDEARIKADNAAQSVQFTND